MGHTNRMIRPTLPRLYQQALEALAAGTNLAQMRDDWRLGRTGVNRRLVQLYFLLGARDRAHAVEIGYQTGVLSVDTPTVLPCLLADEVPLHQMVGARARAKIKRIDVARALGRSEMWLRERELGRAPFTVQEVHAYADLVGFDLSEHAPEARAAA